MQNVLITIGRILMIMISNFGYYNLLRRHTKISVSYFPAITIALQVSVLFLAGILNVIYIAAFLMLGFGIILFAFDLMHHRAKEYLKFKQKSYGYMGICLIILVPFLYGKLFFEYDDFSHWANIVQEIFSYNRYPNADNTLINFPTYPPGTATYIYYFCLLAGNEEWIMMLAQAFMIICTIMPLFECGKKENCILMVIILFFTNFIFVYNVPVTSLLVDTVLPLFGISAFLIALQIYKDSERLSTEQSGIWVIGPMLVMTILIKNSGIFFILPAIIVAVAMIRKDQQHKYLTVMTVLLPFFFLLLWKMHYSCVYQNADITKHSMSLSNYTMQFSEKSSEVIGSIIKSTFLYMVKRPACLYMILLWGILILNDTMNHIGHRKRIIFLVVAGAVLYISYIIGLAGMYIFSMPTEESLKLASIDRYAKSIDIAVFYILFSYLLYDLPTFKWAPKTVVSYILVILVTIGLWFGLTDRQIISRYQENKTRSFFTEAIENYQIPFGASCAVCTSKSEYSYFMVRYLLLSDTVLLTDFVSEEELNTLNNFEYLIMENHDDQMVNQWIAENYPKQFGNDVIVIGFKLNY